MDGLPCFGPEDIRKVGEAGQLAEELVADDYKLSASQWLRHRYDVCTLAELSPQEVAHGPFAQIVRYRGQPAESSLGSRAFDFYRICLQDHTILKALSGRPELSLFPFALYVLCHELVHVVRFSLFLQRFEASLSEKMAEEKRVHEKTCRILQKARVPEVEPLLRFYRAWEPLPDGWAAGGEISGTGP
ncbi:MAG: hypothetical protein JRI97_04380 [Deltaproteobacteria bacterium]|nr:hypothetical protein [Deltaproteobacteria bacterium]